MRVPATLALAAALLCLTGCAKPLKAYDYPAWGFSVSFREPPRVTETPASAGSPKSIRVQSVDTTRDLEVSVTDASTSDKTDEQLMREVPEAVIKGAGGTVVAHRDVTSGGVTGREVTIDRGAAPGEKARIFVTNHRIYQVITQSSDSEDAEAAKFFDSFVLTGK